MRKAVIQQGTVRRKMTMRRAVRQVGRARGKVAREEQ